MSRYAGYAGLVPPRYATPRDPSRATYGGHLAAISAAMGWPLLPWQRYAADVGLEIDDEGQFVYGTVVITVQRQAGKTTLDLAGNVQNSLMGPGRRCWYTAQTGQHATAKWREMVTDVWSESPLAGIAKARLSNGDSSLRFTNGSEFRPHPPTATSLHSKQSDRNTIDEAWSFSTVAFKALMGAITPTQTTRRMLLGQRPQTWIMSTEGTSESEPFNEILDRNREHTAPGVAFFDWGIPADVPMPDATNPIQLAAFFDSVYAAHPGAGYLFTREDLPGFFEGLAQDLSEFARAYGNRRTGATSRVIPEADWNAAGTNEPLPDAAPLCFGAAVGRDGEDATITATALRDDGSKVTEVIRHGIGSTWTAAALKDLTDKWGAPAVIDRAGPSADLYDQAQRAGVELLDIDLRAYTGACTAVYAGIVNVDEEGKKHPATWLHRPHVAMNTAADVAARRSAGDGAWAWGRRASTGSISPMEAATLSTWGVDHLPEQVGMQLFT